jgi:predicted nucleic acid-binding protein
MSVFVVDASVVLKWFIPEIHADAARRLLDDPHQYVAPDLLFAELGSAVWKRVQHGELTREEGRRLMSHIARVAVETVEMRDLIEDAWEIATASGHTVYDSTYLALAVRLETQLVTADRRLVSAARIHPALADHICMVDSFAS